MRTGRIVAPAALLLSLLVAPAAQAQPGPERFEVAANLSMLRVSDHGSTNAGIGGRVTFELTNHVALEGDIEYLPNDRITSPDYRFFPTGSTYRFYDDRNRTTGLFGVKIGTYNPRFGVFAKARPGFTHLRIEGSGCLGVDCQLMYASSQFLAIQYEYRTEFAFDLGGGVEVYPTQRTVARVDVGDTIIRHNSTAMPCISGPCTSHNVSTQVGFGWRF